MLFYRRGGEQDFDSVPIEAGQREEQKVNEERLNCFCSRA